MSKAYIGSIPLIIYGFYVDDNGSEYAKCKLPYYDRPTPILTSLIEVRYENN